MKNAAETKSKIKRAFVEKMLKMKMFIYKDAL